MASFLKKYYAFLSRRGLAGVYEPWSPPAPPKAGKPFNLAIYGWKLRIYANHTQADDRVFGKRGDERQGNIPGRADPGKRGV